MRTQSSGEEGSPRQKGKKNLIIDIWKKERHTILYIDGDRSNRSGENLKWVEIAVALRHASGWETDWEMGLSTNEAAFVRKHHRYFYRQAKVYLRMLPKCAHCGLIEDIDDPLQCNQCKQGCYFCEEHQKAHWPEHKEDCKAMKSRRNNKPDKIVAP